MKLYRVDDVLSDYAEIGGYYIFAENLSDLVKEKVKYKTVHDRDNYSGYKNYKANGEYDL